MQYFTRVKTPSIPHITAALFAIALALAVSNPASGSVIINEIMYQPPGFPENPLGEYIELRNTSVLDADISGWQFTKGVTFIKPVDGEPFVLDIASDDPAAVTGTVEA